MPCEERETPIGGEFLCLFFLSARFFASEDRGETRISKKRGAAGRGTYLAVRVGRVFVAVHGVDVSACRERGRVGVGQDVRGASAGACVESLAMVPTARRCYEPRAYLDTCDSTPW